MELWYYMHRFSDTGEPATAGMLRERAFAEDAGIDVEVLP